MLVNRAAPILILGAVLALLVGCSQPTSVVNIKPVKNPKPSTSDIFNHDLAGATSNVPVSATHDMPINVLGRMSVRTQSVSASFVMTSGIGVD